MAAEMISMNSLDEVWCLLRERLALQPLEALGVVLDLSALWPTTEWTERAQNIPFRSSID